MHIITKRRFKDTIDLDIIKTLEDESATQEIESNISIQALNEHKRSALNACIIDEAGINDKKVCHYTNSMTFPKLIENTSKFRLYNAQYLNDPQEGMLFIDLLKDIGECCNNAIYNKIFQFYENPILKKSDTYIASFTYEKDFLPMWSMYGDDGKGICAELNIDYFSMTRLDEQKKNKKAPKLYNVIYIDPKNETNENEFYYKIISKLNCEIVNICKKISNLPDNDVENYINQITNIIDELRFLFKDKSYSYENECRVVITKKEVELDENNKYFVELPLEIIYKDVIIGPKCGQVAILAQLALHSEKVENVHISSINYQ